MGHYPLYNESFFHTSRYLKVSHWSLSDNKIPQVSCIIIIIIIIIKLEEFLEIYNYLNYAITQQGLLCNKTNHPTNVWKS